jgi:hypothetical protein
VTTSSPRIGLANWALRELPRLLEVEPGLEGLHDDAALRLPHLQVLGRAEQVRFEGGTLDPVDVEDVVRSDLRLLRRGGLGLEELATYLRTEAWQKLLARQ